MDGFAVSTARFQALKFRKKPVYVSIIHLSCFTLEIYKQSDPIGRSSISPKMENWLEGSAKSVNISFLWFEFYFYLLTIFKTLILFSDCSGNRK